MQHTVFLRPKNGPTNRPRAAAALPASLSPYNFGQVNQWYLHPIPPQINPIYSTRLDGVGTSQVIALQLNPHLPHKYRCPTRVMDRPSSKIGTCWEGVVPPLTWSEGTCVFIHTS